MIYFDVADSLTKQLVISLYFLFNVLDSFLNNYFSVCMPMHNINNVNSPVETSVY